MNNDFLLFNKKPKLKVGDQVKEIMADNGHFIFHYDVFVSRIQKTKTHYKVFLDAHRKDK